MIIKTITFAHLDTKEMSRKNMLNYQLSAINDSLMIFIAFGVIFRLLLKHKDAFRTFVFRQVNIAIDEAWDKKLNTRDRRGRVCMGCTDKVIDRI